MLNTVEIRSDHNGKELEMNVKEVLTEFQINENCKLTITNLWLKHYQIIDFLNATHFPCLAHKLQNKVLKIYIVPGIGTIKKSLEKN